jgi:hypothetical protein
MLSPVRLMAVIVSVADCELVPIVPVIAAVVFAPDVCVVVTVKVPDVDPTGIETDAGTVADVEPDVRLTFVTVFCAAEIVTVPVDGYPA